MSPMNLSLPDLTVEGCEDGIEIVMLEPEGERAPAVLLPPPEPPAG